MQRQPNGTGVTDDDSPSSGRFPKTIGGLINDFISEEKNDAPVDHEKMYRCIEKLLRIVEDELLLVGIHIERQNAAGGKAVMSMKRFDCAGDLFVRQPALIDEHFRFVTSYPSEAQKISWVLAHFGFFETLCVESNRQSPRLNPTLLLPQPSGQYVQAVIEKAFEGYSEIIVRTSSIPEHAIMHREVRFFGMHREYSGVHQFLVKARAFIGRLIAHSNCCVPCTKSACGLENPHMRTYFTGSDAGGGDGLLLDNLVVPEVDNPRRLLMCLLLTVHGLMGGDEATAALACYYKVARRAERLLISIFSLGPSLDLSVAATVGVALAMMADDANLSLIDRTLKLSYALRLVEAEMLLSRGRGNNGFQLARLSIAELMADLYRSVIRHVVPHGQEPATPMQARMRFAEEHFAPGENIMRTYFEFMYGTGFTEADESMGAVASAQETSVVLPHDDRTDKQSGVSDDSDVEDPREVGSDDNANETSAPTNETLRIPEGPAAMSDDFDLPEPGSDGELAFALADAWAGDFSETGGSGTEHEKELEEPALYDLDRESADSDCSDWSDIDKGGGYTDDDDDDDDSCQSEKDDEYCGGSGGNDSENATESTKSLPPIWVARANAIKKFLKEKPPGEAVAIHEITTAIKEPLRKVNVLTSANLTSKMFWQHGPALMRHGIRKVTGRTGYYTYDSEKDQHKGGVITKRELSTATLYHKCKARNARGKKRRGTSTIPHRSSIFVTRANTVKQVLRDVFPGEAKYVYEIARAAVDKGLTGGISISAVNISRAIHRNKKLLLAHGIDNIGYHNAGHYIYNSENDEHEGGDIVVGLRGESAKPIDVAWNTHDKGFRRGGLGLQRANAIKTVLKDHRAGAATHFNNIRSVIVEKKIIPGEPKPTKKCLYNAYYTFRETLEKHGVFRQSPGPPRRGRSCEPLRLEYDPGKDDYNGGEFLMEHHYCARGERTRSTQQQSTEETQERSKRQRTARDTAHCDNNESQGSSARPRRRRTRRGMPYSDRVAAYREAASIARDTEPLLFDAQD